MALLTPKINSVPPYRKTFPNVRLLQKLCNQEEWSDIFKVVRQYPPRILSLAELSFKTEDYEQVEHSGFLGWWKYSALYYNNESMSLFAVAVKSFSLVWLFATLWMQPLRLLFNAIFPRILKWVAIFSSPGDLPHPHPCISRQILYPEPLGRSTCHYRLAQTQRS